MTRLNWNQRQGPEEFDDTAPHRETFEFDYSHSGGAAPWPKGFGPASIKKAWQAGLIVLAEVDGFNHPVAVTESRTVSTSALTRLRTRSFWLGGIPPFIKSDYWRRLPAATAASVVTIPMIRRIQRTATI